MPSDMNDRLARAKDRLRSKQDIGRVEEFGFGFFEGSQGKRMIRGTKRFPR
jgi:hypothetical protein